MCTAAAHGPYYISDAVRYLKRWTNEWEADLEARSEEVKDTSSGIQATIQFQQTVSFLKPLFKQLKRRQVHKQYVSVCIDTSMSCRV